MEAMHTAYEHGWSPGTTKLASNRPPLIPTFGQQKSTAKTTCSSVYIPVVKPFGPIKRPQPPVDPSSSSAARREHLEMSRTLLYNSLEELAPAGGQREVCSMAVNSEWFVTCHWLYLHRAAEKVLYICVSQNSQAA